MSKWELFNILSKRGTANITIDNCSGILTSIQREDGSGQKFILTITQFGGTQDKPTSMERKIFIKTDD